MIKIIRSISEWNEIRGQWNDLHKSSNSTPFQSFSFQYSSWINLVDDGTLHIIVIEKGNQLLAIFPTYINKNGILCFINGRHIDFCSALVLPEFEYDYHLYEEFADYIKNNNQIKGYIFDNLKEDNYFSSILCYFFKGSIVTITNHWSYCNIKSSDYTNSIFDAFENLNRKEKYRLKNILSKSQDLKFDYFTIMDKSFPSDMIHKLIDYMIQSGIRTEAYFSESFTNVIKDSYNDGIIDFGVTSNENGPLSCNMYMKKGNEYINWLAIYKDGKENTTNLLQMAKFIREDGGGVLNFARGIYPYKVHNFRPQIHNLYKITYRKKSLSRFFLLFDTYIYYLKQVVKSIIRK